MMKYFSTFLYLYCFLLLATTSLTTFTQAQTNSINATYGLIVDTQIPSLPPTLPSNAITLPPSNDNVNTLNLGFIFSFFGRLYSTMTISADGNIQFRTAVVDTSPEPLPTGNHALTPLLAFFYTDLYPNGATHRQYVTQGQYPNRTFTLRLENVPYFSTRFTTNPPSVSMDVILFEQDSHIEIMYYRVDASTQNVLIGVVNSGVSSETNSSLDYTFLYNVEPLNTTISTSLNRTRVVIQPLVAVPPPYYATLTTYKMNLENRIEYLTLDNPISLGADDDGLITDISLGFNFSFYHSVYSTVAISLNGFIQFGDNPNDFGLPSPMPLGNSDLLPIVAFFFADLNTDVEGSRVYQSMGTEPNRYFVVRFDRSRYCCMGTGYGPVSVDVILFENTSSIEVRFHSLGVSTDAVLIGIQYNQQERAENVYDYTAYLNGQALTQAGVNALVNKTLVFSYASEESYPNPIPLSYRSSRTDSVPVFTPLSNPRYIAGSNDDIDTINIGFPFYFYGTYYSRVNLGSNGEIQFKTMNTSSIPTPMPFETNMLLPILAYFYTDLYPVAATAKSFETTGTFPNRIFTLRLDHVPYYECQSSFVTIDIRLFEVDGHIDIVYYNLDACESQSILVGSQANSIRRSDYSYDYVTVVNHASAYPEVVNTLNGSTVSFHSQTPIPQPPVLTSVAVGNYSMTQFSYLDGPISLTSSTSLGAINTAVSVALGFNFTFYGRVYSSVTVSPNGVLQFASSQRLFSPQAMPSGNTAIRPFIAFAYTYQLYNSYINDASRYYTTTGEIGNRMFVLRFNGTRYAFDSTRSIMVDVVLFESDNSIEMRYHRLDDTDSNPTLIGIQGTSTSSDYVSVVNAINLNTTLSSLIQGTTLRFSLMGSPLSSSSTGAASFSSSSSSGEIIGMSSSIDIPSTSSASFPSPSSSDHVISDSSSSSSFSEPIVPSSSAMEVVSSSSSSAEVHPASSSEIFASSAAFESSSASIVSSSASPSESGSLSSSNSVLTSSSGVVDLSSIGSSAVVEMSSSSTGEGNLPEPSSTAIESGISSIAVDSSAISSIAVETSSSSAPSVSSSDLSSSVALTSSSSDTIVVSSSSENIAPSSSSASSSSSSVPATVSSSSSSVSESSSIALLSSSESVSSSTQASSSSSAAPSSSSSSELLSSSVVLPSASSSSSSSISSEIVSSSSSSVDASSSSSSIVQSSSALSSSSSVSTSISSSSSSSEVNNDECSFGNDIPSGTISTDLLLPADQLPSFTILSIVAVIRNTISLRDASMLQCGAIRSSIITNAITPVSGQSVLPLYFVPSSTGDQSAQDAYTSFVTAYDNGDLNSALAGQSLPTIQQVESSQYCDGKLISVNDQCTVSDDDSDDGLSNGALAGIIIGSVVGGIILIALIFLLITVSRRKASHVSSDSTSKHPSNDMHHQTTDPDHTERELSAVGSSEIELAGRQPNSTEDSNALQSNMSHIEYYDDPSQTPHHPSQRHLVDHQEDSTRSARAITYDIV
jgi:hypothetical protein